MCDYLTFKKRIHLHKQYIFDSNNIQSEYAFLFPFSIYNMFDIVLLCLLEIFQIMVLLFAVFWTEWNFTFGELWYIFYYMCYFKIYLINLVVFFMYQSLHKNGNRRYKFLVLGRQGPYFVKEHSDSKNKYTEDDIINMLEFLVDYIFVLFGDKVFQQIVGIPMGTNCALLRADIFLYSYEAEFIQSLLSTGKTKVASQFNFTYRYIDDVLSINNPDFENYLGQMYPSELEIKDKTESNTSASYLDLLLSIESDGQLRTSLYDKRDDFNFHITNFPFLSSNIPSSPAYDVFISQHIRYARAWSSYDCFILRAARLSSKLLGQGYVKERLKSSLRKFYDRYGDLIKHYEVSLSQMLHDILGHDHIQWHTQLIRHYPNLRTYYRTGLYYWFWPYYQILEVSMEHCNRCG